MDPTKTLLIVLRHAHAAKAEGGQGDYERPLDERGRREAEEAGRVLADLGARPARIVSSGSTRTRQTIAGLGAAFGGIETSFADALYHDGMAAYLAAARAAAGGSVMLVGHNPSVAEFIAHLAGEGDRDAMRQMAEGVPPGSFALIEFKTPLADIAAGSGFLTRLFTPSRR